MRRTDRLIQMTKALADRPGRLVSLSEVAALLDAAKSSLSEDVAMIRDVFSDTGEGTVATVPGAAGGVVYRPSVPRPQRQAFLSLLQQRLQDPSRVLPGGFLYMTDLLGDPEVLDTLGRLMAARYAGSGLNVIVTVEMKGIPLAVAAARYLNVPVVVVRRDHRVTDGPSVTMHYVSGSERRIQTMSISKRAMPAQASALIVDDFMRAGATVKAVSSLLSEFGAQVVGTAVLMATEIPEQKLVTDYLALFTVGELAEGQPFRLRFVDPLEDGAATAKSVLSETANQTTNGGD